MASFDVSKLNRFIDKIFKEKIEEVEAILASKRCKNCRWWGGESGFGEDGPLRYCRLSMMQFHPGDDLPDEKARAVAASTGDFYTGPDFGCVHFEVKESEPTQ